MKYKCKEMINPLQLGCLQFHVSQIFRDKKHRPPSGYSAITSLIKEISSEVTFRPLYTNSVCMKYYKHNGFKNASRKFIIFVFVFVYSLEG